MSTCTSNEWVGCLAVYLDVMSVEINDYICLTRTIVQDRTAVFWHLPWLASSTPTSSNSWRFKRLTAASTNLTRNMWRDNMSDTLDGSDISSLLRDHAVSVQMILTSFSTLWRWAVAVRTRSMFQGIKRQFWLSGIAQKSTIIARWFTRDYAGGIIELTSCEKSSAKCFVQVLAAIRSSTAHALHEAYSCCSFTSSDIDSWRVPYRVRWENANKLHICVSKLENYMIATTLVTPWDLALGVSDSRHFFNMIAAISSTGYLEYLEILLYNWMVGGANCVF